MPIGSLVAVVLVALCTWLGVAPIRRPRAFGEMSFRLGFLVNEQPFLAGYLVLASTLLAAAEGDLDSPVGTETGADVHHRLPWARILVAPFFFRRHDVERLANIAYGDGGAQNRLDLYRHLSRPAGSPTLIHLHGGHFRSGRKNREARPLFYRLASRGWVCISANYRLTPAAVFPDQLIDVKKVLAWVREHGHEFGADPAVVFVAGSSAGGHLAAMAALTPNDPRFQRGFEDADTSVTAAICLYAYYGALDIEQPPSSPLDYIGAHAPPFFIAHGDQDTVVPVQDARRFAERLRSTSSNPVVDAELLGAQHAFDLFHSIRFERVIDAIEAFAASVRSGPAVT
jgi:acetyl esterase/lipase